MAKDRDGTVVAFPGAATPAGAPDLARVERMALLAAQLAALAGALIEVNNFLIKAVQTVDQEVKLLSEPGETRP